MTKSGDRAYRSVVPPSARTPQPAGLTRPAPQGLPRWAAASVLAAFGGMAAPVQAAIGVPSGYFARVGDLLYEVTILPFGTFDDNRVAITSPDNLVWGNAPLAGDLASSADTISFGTVNTDLFGLNWELSAFFSYQEGTQDDNIYATWLFTAPGSGIPDDTLLPAAGTDNNEANGITWNYHYATAVIANGFSPDDPFLPQNIDNGSFVFMLDGEVIQPGDHIFIDPEIAIGYNYVVNNALFDEVEAPVLPFDSQYDLFGSNDSCSTYTVPLGTLTGGTPFDLSANPLPCFSIQGIAVEDMLDPTDTLAFVTGISLTSITGNPMVTQTPITTFVGGGTGVPAPLPIFGASMALGWSRRLRARVKSARVR